jgi:hypothetical protein
MKNCVVLCVNSFCVCVCACVCVCVCVCVFFIFYNILFCFVFFIGEDQEDQASSGFEDAVSQATAEKHRIKPVSESSADSSRPSHMGMYAVPTHIFFFCGKTGAFCCR